MKQLIYLSVAAALSLGFAGSPLAHGGNASLVHGCIKNSNGATRIVGRSAECTSGEYVKQ